MERDYTKDTRKRHEFKFADGYTIKFVEANADFMIEMMDEDISEGQMIKKLLMSTYAKANKVGMKEGEFANMSKADLQELTPFLMKINGMAPEEGEEKKD